MIKSPKWTSVKKICIWQITIWKDVQHHTLLENCTLKQHWDSTTYLLERPKFKALTTPNADEDMEQKELSFITAWKAKWHNQFERQLGGFLQI